MAKILLVEDDKSLREIYGVRLMAEGYQIVSAGDGEEALAMAIKERPDLIVSDVMMPKISGFDMLDILRSTTETKDVKVIMMTALSSEDQRARGEALGADRYLVKSQVGIEDVVRTVHDVLGDSPSAGAPQVSAYATPAPEPVAAPIAAPVAAPVAPVPVAAPVVEPVAPVAAPAPIINTAPEPVAAPVPFVPAPAPVAPVAPMAPPVFTGAPSAPPPVPVAYAPAPAPIAAPVAAPAPLAPPAPVAYAPVAPAPVAPVATPVAAPVAPVPQPVPTALPQPTAPFSSPRPASLGDRVINPISPAGDFQTPPDLGNLMNQELNNAEPPAQTPPAAL